MQTTICVMVGKGSVNHNSRIFHAENTDPERSHLNTSYCNMPIKKVYTELFDEAVKKYNEKQTRSDRCINDYYEKIRSGKQEKPFHEIILQIGNCEDMGVKTENGQLAAKILDEFMQNFQNRNPNLKVFSAHLHMDEATPHLHIDFVPFITESSRGLFTRVSLKQALFAQGFKGGTRQDTEWNQWVHSEKQQLAKVMVKHDVQWEQKGTHEKHLSVLNYEKKMRTQEVEKLDGEITDRKINVLALEEKQFKLSENLDEIKDNLQTEKQKFEQFSAINQGLEKDLEKYNVDAEWQLPEPTAFTTAKSYKEKIVAPLIIKFKKVINALFSEFHRLNDTYDWVRNRVWQLEGQVSNLLENLERTESERNDLRKIEKDYKLIRKELGEEKTEDILAKAQQKQEQYNITNRRNRNYDYER
jgi:hypothetical protein